MHFFLGYFDYCNNIFRNRSSGITYTKQEVHMRRFIIRWVINAIALYVAILVVNKTIGGISLQNPSWQSYLWMGLIFGFINALLRPLLEVLTCPLIILTLGLFTFILNTLFFYMVGWIGSSFNVGFSVASFWSALLAAVIVSVVSIALSLVLGESRKPRLRHIH
jgi:putative membrane protein